MLFRTMYHMIIQERLAPNVEPSELELEQMKSKQDAFIAGQENVKHRLKNLFNDNIDSEYYDRWEKSAQCPYS